MTTQPTAASLAAPAPVPPGRAPWALELTLDPIGHVEFLDAYCDRRPLIVERGEPGRFDAVLSDADVERLVCETAIRSPAFRLVRDGAQLPLAGYTRDIPWRPGSFTGTAVVDRVAEEHAAGATLVLQALHLHHHPAALYCRGLEIALGWPVQANAYCTPAGSQGFAVHHDTHDVFVLQVSGHKRWRIYAPVVELPAKDQRWQAAAADGVGAPLHDITLRAGDTLYIARGWPHEAAAADAGSLHVTVGLHPPTRLDALRAALAECGDDVEFRRALGADGELPAELVERLAARLDPQDVARRARRRFVDTRRPILDGQLTQMRALAGLTTQTLLDRRATVIADLEPRAGGGVALRFEGKEVRFPPQAATAVAAVHGARAPFVAAELPGPLDASGRLVLVRRLVREGFVLQPVVPR
ncbi:MAG: bifunctional lysine-specific demethylase and histidyl-hydroxylase [Solirubrobacteraceae bacterium]|nr:bifunctional lysine-specific demethylase and histidyl-hydroxylase [Solirubrobacteraceae bacterium]